jgi:glyceraldehyde 3-phosphate dehydrogenase
MSSAAPRRIRVGINGFGRMGRLAFRAAWAHASILQFVHINELAGDANQCAHLLTYDSVHGKWGTSVRADDAHSMAIGEGENLQKVTFSRHASPDSVPWKALGVDLVLECTGAFVTKEKLEAVYTGHADSPRKVVISAPVKGLLNVVMGVNQHEYDAAKPIFVTAASCTTNCLAPIVAVIHKQLGIVHGSITTVHNLTNTQVIVDVPLDDTKDLRRNRAGGLSLIPTTTGSATAIGLIFPELQGKLNGLAIRCPLLNASITDCVFEVKRATTAAEVNALLSAASSHPPLAGILGVEKLALVGADYKDDPRSAIVDAPSTLVIDGTQVKILAWYDNEWGYACRMVELAKMVATTM